jgi:hypothetical protein
MTGRGMKAVRSRRPPVTKRKIEMEIKSRSHLAAGFSIDASSDRLPIPRSIHLARTRQLYPSYELDIAFDDFARFDVRIGKVVDIKPFPPSRHPSYQAGVNVSA